MEKQIIYFIYMPSPMLGRSLMQGIGGLGLFSNLFDIYTEDEYISALNSELVRRKLNWIVQMDDTGSDIERIIEKKIKLLVCTPGLKYQFNKGDFNKENIIYLSVMEFANKVVEPVINRIRILENEGKT